MTTVLPSPHKEQKGKSQQIRRLVGSSRSSTKMGRISMAEAGLVCFVSSLLCFYFGMVLGSSAAQNCTNNRPSTFIDHKNCLTEEQVIERIEVEVKKAHSNRDESSNNNRTDPKAFRFPLGMEHLVAGSAQIPRDDFTTRFNLGVPLDPSDSRNNKVLLLYNDEKAIPTNIRSAAMSQTSMPELSAENATARCNFLHIILQDHSGARRQCTAILGQYEAFHIQKLMRLPEKKAPLSSNLPLRVVNRGSQSSGRKSTAPPSVETTREFWKTLQTYLGHLDEILEKLKPIAERINDQNTVIVQVCNFGQSELLLNFLCSAKRRGLDTSAILVFATDKETYDLANGLGGVTVFYDEVLFGDMPIKAAGSYGDKIFMKMMMAKIYCVQLINLLGYDVLFQDVDVVWYRNPLAYFHDKDSQDAGFDVYFQDDGNHALFYAPYSANTGFYYVRNNERTRYFFNSFLMAGDLVVETRSHQIPLVALLQEHSSMYGLKIKIFSRDGDLFPGGHAFHRRKGLLKDMFAGNAHPQIFHMSWTSSKVNKVKFFQQMGEWFLDDSCKAKTVVDIWGADSPDDMISKCCGVEPKITCHYKDKPSKIPCKDSPSIDKLGRSFW